MKKSRFWDFMDRNVWFPTMIVIMIFFTVICVLGGIYASNNKTNDSMNARADAVARCKSLGGEMGGEKCFVNGVEK